MKHKEDGFWAVPKGVANLNISEGAKLCYAVLWTRKNGANVAWPGKLYIADSLGVSVRTVDRYIGELNKHKLITIKRRGLKKTNVYIFPDTTDMSHLDTTEVSHPIVREEKEDISADADIEYLPDETTLTKKQIKQNEARKAGVIPQEDIKWCVQKFKDEMKEAFGQEPMVPHQAAVNTNFSPFLKKWKKEDYAKLLEELLYNQDSPWCVQKQRRWTLTLLDSVSVRAINVWQQL